MQSQEISQEAITPGCVIDDLGASFISRESGLAPNVISNWKRRGKIPAEYFPMLVTVGKLAGKDYTLEQLHGMGNQTNSPVNTLNQPTGK